MISIFRQDDGNELQLLGFMELSGPELLDKLGSPYGMWPANVCLCCLNVAL
jgi:hypothetical protein